MPDWDLLRWWLHRCEPAHGTLYLLTQGNLANERQLPQNMRVIDVLEKRVGERLMGWPMPTTNKEQFRGRNVDGSIPLPEKLPRTVFDAIEVTRCLGYQYLWVDALCIIQGNDADRHSQLLKMDSIYRYANLSIAAASSSHADSGLPGISSPREFDQRRETISGVRLAVPLLRFDELNTGDHLKWNTREWTFQEKALSQRTLIFTDYKAHFKCSNAVWSEVTAAETSGLTRPGDKALFRWSDDNIPRDYSTRRPYSLVNFLSFVTLSLVGLDCFDLFVIYRAVVEEYTKRHLSYQRDTLPAIDGVLRLLNPHPEAYLEGLPKEFFAKAILWHPNLEESCIEMTESGVPSWSWARWKFHQGCTWWAGDMKMTLHFEAGVQHTRYRTSATTSANLRHLPNDMHHQLRESGCLLGWQSASANLAVVDPISHQTILKTEADDLFDVFTLDIPNAKSQGDVGEVITTLEMWRR